MQSPSAAGVAGAKQYEEDAPHSDSNYKMLKKLLTTDVPDSTDSTYISGAPTKHHIQIVAH